MTIYHSLPVPGDQSFVRTVDYDLVGGLRLLRGLGHDVLYTSQSFLPVLQLRINKWLTKRPYLYTLNGAIWAYYAERRASLRLAPAKRALYPALLKQAMNGADAVVANSRFLAGALRDRFPALASKFTAIYNGIDYDAIDAGEPRIDAWPQGTTRVLSVVTLDFERKTEGSMLLLDAFDILSERRPGLSYLIAAKSANLATAARIRKHIGRLRRANQVRLELNRKDIPDLLAAADLFLYATPADSSDSLPRALLEAQAAGVPTVTTATTGCGEVVLDGETGRAVPYDASALAEAGSQLLSDAELSSRMAARGQQSVRQQFRWDLMADQYEELFLRMALTRS